MRGSGNGAARQFGRAGLGWAGLVGPCSLVMRHNWAKTRLVLRLISSYVCLFVCFFVMGFSLWPSKKGLWPCWQKWEAPEMLLRGKWASWFGPTIVPCSPAMGWMQHNLAQTRWELHLWFVSRIDRTRIDGRLARILIRSYCTRKQNNFPMSKIQVRCLNLNLELSKGQLISECLFAALNFPENQQKIWQISVLESKR